MQVPILAPAALLRLLASPSGEIGRGRFSIGVASLAGFSVVADRLLALVPDASGLTPFAFALLVAWCAGCLSRKRLHDIGWSGAAIAVFLAGYIAVVVLSPFIMPLPPEGSFARSLLLATLLGGPIMGWCACLAAAPGAIHPATLRGEDLLHRTA